MKTLHLIIYFDLPVFTVIFLKSDAKFFYSSKSKLPIEILLIIVESDTLISLFLILGKTGLQIEIKVMIISHENLQYCYAMVIIHIFIKLLLTQNYEYKNFIHFLERHPKINMHLFHYLPKTNVYLFSFLCFYSIARLIRRTLIHSELPGLKDKKHPKIGFFKEIQYSNRHKSRVRSCGKFSSSALNSIAEQSALHSFLFCFLNLIDLVIDSPRISTLNS
ncbi:hypothetical protein BpHYR1_045618 [Brachionus plicatilis]|uniref:Uncharacterized protein n=1 Tax=Brachionus plicatilis TaxID=10195 RepID=A0A3M7PCA2_BRAPC|nr:hypothetical protein BpHYR1_045618 [Brachionus plicatilis]